MARRRDSRSDTTRASAPGLPHRRRVTVQAIAQSDLAAGDSSQLRLKVAERVLIAGLRAQERADASTAAQQRLAFLLDASRRLGASLETATIMQALMDIVVPELADAATLRVIDPARHQPRVAVATAEPLAAHPLAWWDWLDRLAQPQVRRAMRRGSSEIG